MIEKRGSSMLSYIKAVYLEVFIKAFCFLKYKQSFSVSHEAVVGLYLWISFLHYTRET